jgi:predicted amidohydrolase
MNSQESVSENLAEVSRLVRQAAGDAVRLLVLPENFAYFGPESGRREVAESLDGDGPIISTLRQLAREHEMKLIGGGMPERSDDPARPYNTAVVIDAEGEVLAHYQKMHLFDVDLADGTVLTESRSTTPGQAPRLAGIDGFEVGLTICYDVRFPELYRRLSERGAELITMTAAFTVPTGEAHYEPLLRARAIENQVWVLASAQWGTHPVNRTTFGHSMIIDPWGAVASSLEQGVGLCVADISRERLDAVRRQLPSLRHRRL